MLTRDRSDILSQLVGSTLALQYLRAEFVAPLGSSSLVFNFLFARALVRRAALPALCRLLADFATLGISWVLQ